MAVQPSSTPESCCICDEEFANVTDLVAHLIRHCEDAEFKEMLEDNGITYEQTAASISPSQPVQSQFMRTNLASVSAINTTVVKKPSSPIVVDLSDSDEEKPVLPILTPQPSKSNSLVPVELPKRGRPFTNVPNKTRNSMPDKIAQRQTSTAPRRASSDSKSTRESSSTALQEKPRPFSCHICNKSFAYRGTLRQHLRNHIGDKSHQCPKCDKRFTIKDVLRQHMQDVHKSSHD